MKVGEADRILDLSVDPQRIKHQDPEVRVRALHCSVAPSTESTPEGVSAWSRARGEAERRWKRLAVSECLRRISDAEASAMRKHYR